MIHRERISSLKRRNHKDTKTRRHRTQIHRNSPQKHRDTERKEGFFDGGNGAGLRSSPPAERSAAPNTSVRLARPIRRLAVLGAQRFRLRSAHTRPPLFWRGGQAGVTPTRIHFAYQFFEAGWACRRHDLAVHEIGGRDAASRPAITEPRVHGPWTGDTGRLAPGSSCDGFVPLRLCVLVFATLRCLCVCDGAGGGLCVSESLW